jgi:hypothetical protein
MITGITIANFKGIREPVHLQFRPITLLFGANSAGKSSILHALHYAREVFERRNYSPDLTIASGGTLDLGGFDHLMHGHNRDQVLKLGIELGRDQWRSNYIQVQPVIQDETVDVDPLLEDPKSIAIDLDIVWSEIANRPLVTSCSIQMNGQRIGLVQFQAGKREASCEIDLAHPIWKPSDDCMQLLDFLGYHESDIPEPSDQTSGFELLIQKTEELLLHFGDYLPEEKRLVFQAIADDALPDPSHFSPSRLSDNAAGDSFQVTIEALLAGTIRSIFCGAVSSVIRDLNRCRFLGPLRATPTREFRSPRFVDPSRWASGLGAWDALVHSDGSLVDEVSQWMSDEDRLNAKCSILQKRYVEVDLSDPLVRALLDGRAFDDVENGKNLLLDAQRSKSRLIILASDGKTELQPHDVGTGITQILPVVVAALDSQSQFVSIEQPELHIHPRMQAALGDLFLSSVRSKEHAFLIETHSEHLILRLLRRIRETDKGRAPREFELRTDEIAIYYLEQVGGATNARRIDVDVNGDFIQPWPDDFFEIDFYERFTTGEEK